MTPATGEGDLAPPCQEPLPCPAVGALSKPRGLQKWVDTGFWPVLPGTPHAGAGTRFFRVHKQERGCVSCPLFPSSVLSLGFVATVSLVFL